jgi:3-deoxy-D-manno-octulosonate 8-phosphate phosphatase (KDO 8-P phosphatase)
VDISSINEEITNRASKVKLLLMDCDGVLTDGKLYYDENGEALKVFDVKDGQGIANWHSAGFICGVITGRESKALERRVNELGVKFLRQASKDKLKDCYEIMRLANVEICEVAFIGDDLPDLELLKDVGFAIGVNDCHIILKPHIHYKTLKNGGAGAVRESVDLILMTKSLSQLDIKPKI